MKKKMGFTLVELLAVIVLVAVVALIAMPTFSNIISDSRHSAFARSVENMCEAIDWYLLDIYDGKYASNKIFTLDSNGIVESCSPGQIDESMGNCVKLKYDGSVNGEGEIIVNPSGDYYIHYSNGIYCATKEFEDEKIRVTEGSCSE